MAPTKLKAAYLTFFIFFSTWVALLWLTCFPSGVWTDPVRFPNTFMLALFMVSGSIAAASCVVLGLDYLGIHFRSRHAGSAKAVGNQSPAVLESREPAAEGCNAPVIQESQSDTADIEKPQEPSSAH